MRPVLVLPEDLVLHLEGHIALSGEPPLYLVSRPSLRARLTRRKARAVTGDPEDSAAYRRALGRGRGPLVVAARLCDFFSIRNLLASVQASV